MPDVVIETLTNPWGIFLLVLSGTVAGWFLQASAPDGRHGLLGVVIRGFLGALAGLWVAAMLHLPGLLVLSFQGLAFPLGYALLGGILFMLTFRMLHI